MTQHEGFLVVQQQPHDLTCRNPRYRGVDRTPPFSMSKLEEGFEDPLVFGNATDGAGLIRSAPLAMHVKTQFKTNEPREKLEIVYARSVNGVTPSSTTIPTDRFLGFDVAGSTSPFLFHRR